MLKISEDTLHLNQEQQEVIQDLLSRYPSDRKKSALLPLLHHLQDWNQNYLSQAIMNQAASILNIEPIEVYEVATFYSMYNLKPVGKYLLEVCRTGPCMIEGAEDLVHWIEKRLQIKEGETTTDGLFTLKCVECLGACGYAPMLQQGDKYFEKLTEEKINSLIDQWQNQAHSVN